MATFIDENSISLRFKYDIYTIFHFTNYQAPFSKITEELLAILRERYPAGLGRDENAMEPLMIPAESDQYKVSFAVLKNLKDVSLGWKPLKLTGSETPTSLKLKDNSVLAFDIQTDDAVDEAPQFYVKFPELEDDVNN